MKSNLTLTLTLTTAAIAILACVSQAHAQGCARVEVQNLRPGQGPLMLAAYGDEASFRKTPVSQLQMAVSSETVQLQVCGLSGHSVALTLFQDLNGNAKLDLNPFGVPTEPWGASGKPTPMAAPTWESSQVPLDGSTIVVKLSK